MFTIDSYVSAVIAHSKTKTWWNCTVEVSHGGKIHTVGCKAFGLWVQRVECNGIRSDVPECKTQRAFREAFVRELEKILR